MQAIGEVEPEDINEQAWSTRIFPVEGNRNNLAASSDAVQNGTICPDWTGDADSRHAALMQAIGEVEPEDINEQAWSTRIFPVEGNRNNNPAASSDAVQNGTICPDWTGDADSRHAALMQAIGEVEPEDINEQAWSTRIFPVEGNRNNLAASSDAVQNGTICPDWTGDANSRHAALMQAIGEVEPEDINEQAWSTRIFPVEDNRNNLAASSDAVQNGTICPDWTGDADSRHAALMQAIGEVEPEDINEQAWSTRIFPVEGNRNNLAASSDAVQNGTICPDWTGDADSRHEALMQAIGEVEPEDINEQAWSTRIFPVEGNRNNNPAAGSDAVQNGIICPDWTGDADSRHAAPLMQAIGEVEPEDINEQAWSIRIFPVEGNRNNLAASSDAVQNGTICPDWTGDADSRHAALMQAIGEVEPEDINEQAWSTRIFPVEGNRNNNPAASSDAVQNGTICPDWTGDADSRHAALMQAIGEVEPEDINEQAWSTRIFPVEGNRNNLAASSDAVQNGTICPDWTGDADSRHAALMQAIGEVEPEDINEQAWSTRIFPVEGNRNNLAASSDAVQNGTICPDWTGDADSRHAALMQAIGEVEPEDINEQAWSTRIFPVEGNRNNLAASSDAVQNGTICPDWTGDADSRHAALMQAIGEVEPEDINEQAWSTRIFPVEGNRNNNPAASSDAVQNGTICPDWTGGADSRHASLMQAIGEVEPEDINEQGWLALISWVSRRL